MTKQSIFRARRYSKVTLDGTEDSNILFTAEENCTLRRIIMRIVYVKDSGVVSETAAWYQLAIAPNGNDVVDSLTTLGIQSEVDLPYEYIGGGVIPNNSGGGSPDVFDSKGMRKLRKDDQIILNTLNTVETGSTTGSFIAYYVDMFFGQ